MKAFSIASTLMLLGAVSAAPTNDDTTYPEVVPGPGLPSLASLGLTSADLYKMPPGLSPRSIFNLFARQSANCFPSTAQILDVAACYNYLNNLGGTACSVPANGISQFCFANTAQILGQSEVSGSGASQPCGNVAQGVLAVIDNCRITGTTAVGGGASVTAGSVASGVPMYVEVNNT